ncbi:MAG: adenylate/guanylate cyclase domain-containing protein [Candidatus Dormiibacterota bacterium]
MQAAASAERRLVSVLFADLVGFTSLSETRDAEEVRELLTRYFDSCRALIERYGGTVETFIGDAVMAVWGAPLSHEDDAERAVRAALDLVDAVAALGAQVGMSGLQVRAGVLTGEAAVSMGVQAQGMVAGDLVNTASRIQGAAEPGTVLVGDATRRATEAALVYEDGGERTLKGRTEPMHLWRALRVVSGRGGALKAEGLEAPFVGRKRELGLIKDLFHATAEEGRAHLVSVVGIPGIGKSRLSWELYKYIDGVALDVLWHRGRCLAYGEGVAYSALAEMVRMRAGIAEGEDTAGSRVKLQSCLDEYISDPEERRWLEPRLAHLLGLEERAVSEREDLFSAWRLFLERLAENTPTVLVFEDMQWADTSLLDFIEYLLDWSRNHALYLLTLSRPELSERRPGWGADRRNFTPLYLEPLPARAMEEMLDGLVPGLPDELREQILRRAEGVPLYAMETVRMLLDRGLLSRAGSVYRLTGQVEELAVPQSLQALIAARLDGLAADARRLLQEASVLGKTFTASGLSAVSGLTLEQAEPLLADLVRKEVLSIQADPRSPERGQYGFLQDLVRLVAYETLSKRDRKEKHLATARWLESSWGGDESDVVEVVASHYLEAYRLAPGDADADSIRERAADVLVRAGERAASLAASAEAEHYFEQAVQLTGESVRQAELHERAGEMAWKTGRSEAATQHYERAISMFEAQGSPHPAARVLARLGDVSWQMGHLDEALERMEKAFAVVAGDPPDADLAALSAQLGRLHLFEGRLDLAAERIQTALDLAEAFEFTEVLAQALITKGLIALNSSHPEEAFALFTHAFTFADDNDLPATAIRAQTNIGAALAQRDRYAEALASVQSNVARARKMGDRRFELTAKAAFSEALVRLGRWDEAAGVAADFTEAELRDTPNMLWDLLSGLGELHVQRGQLAELERLLGVFQTLENSADPTDRAIYAVRRAAWLRAEGRFAEALGSAEQALTSMALLGTGNEAVKDAYREALDAAFGLGDLGRAEDLLATVESLRPGDRPPALRAHISRFRGRLGHARGEDAGVDAAFAAAAGLFRELGFSFWVGVTLLEHGEWHLDRGRAGEAEPLLVEAREVFGRLQARPWLERLERLRLDGVALPTALGGESAARMG